MILYDPIWWFIVLQYMYHLHGNVLNDFFTKYFNNSGILFKVLLFRNGWIISYIPASFLSSLAADLFKSSVIQNCSVYGKLTNTFMLVPRWIHYMILLFSSFLLLQGKEGGFVVRKSSREGMYTLSIW